MNSAREACDVAVIGAGMAGMAAALFAAERGLSCVQIGNGGGILFASGLLDLLGVHPVAERRPWVDPYAGLSALRSDHPEHPLTRVDAAAIRRAFETLLAALSAAGLPYAALSDKNRGVPTSVGTIKTTFAIPRSMVAAADALDQRLPCLIVDFRGLREFSAGQIVAALNGSWPGLRQQRIEFPGSEAAGELYSAHVARALESTETLARTLERVRPFLGDARAVGFPAVLGLARSAAVHAAFEAGLGVPVFEIPTMPTSVPGLRLQGALEAANAARGVIRRHQANVSALRFDGEGNTAVLEVDGLPRTERILARTVILATGRFSGRGLAAERDQVRERLLGLPVRQPATRADWHQREFLHPAGHAVNRAGIAVDAAWRALGPSGKPAWERLHAVGAILAGQDWMREKCGSGLAVATAWAATAQIARELGRDG